MGRDHPALAPRGLNPDENDRAAGPWVSFGNRAFRDFYCLQAIPDPTLSVNHLSGVAMLDRLQAMGVLDNREAFEMDQRRIGEAIFYRQQNPPAKEPLAINENHDDPRFRGRKFLPTIVVRLLLQHLGDVPGALAGVARVTASGGSALVIDALDRLRTFHPPLPGFLDFFERYRERERAAGRDRDVMERLPAIAHEAGGWTVGAAWDVLIPATFPGHLEVFRAVYSRVIDLLAPELAHLCDVPSVRREWADWCANDLAYAQVGLRIVRLDRV
jgi:hypothetical protein